MSARLRSPWEYRSGEPEPGLRVIVLSQRNREGIVIGRCWIGGGGAGHRIATLVRLLPTKRAAERQVRVYPSSLVPVVPSDGSGQR